MKITQAQINALKVILNYYFKIDNKPAGDQMGAGQLEIVAAIFYKRLPRYACLAPTGYGKSEAIAIGVILRVYLKAEDFIIASVKYGTSEIIMKKIIEHIFDNDNIIAELEIDKGKKLSTLKRERNKQSINFKKGGSIRVISLHGADSDVSSAIGEHVPNVILDESPLLTPAKYLLLLKMLEGTGSYATTFLFESGNAVNRNHFLNNIKYNSKYIPIDISLEQALEEGRLDEEGVNEKRGLPFFEQFYLCKFPEEDEIDEKGYRQLVTSLQIEQSCILEFEISQEPMRLGVDVGGGGDYNVYCIRQGNKAWFETQNKSNDTMTNVNEVIRLIDKFTLNVGDQKIKLLKAENIFIDDIGIGRGVTDRLIELGYAVNGVSVGGKPQDGDKYANIKAENYWLSGVWLRDKNNQILKADEWQQLTQIKYKISTDKVLKIEPKEDLKKRTGKSPDHAEAFMLTFSVGNPEPNLRWL